MLMNPSADQNEVSVMKRSLVVLTSAVLLAVSCSDAPRVGQTTSTLQAAPVSRSSTGSSSSAVNSPEPEPSSTSTSIPTTTTMPPRDCTPEAPPILRLSEPDPTIATVELSRMVYPCAEVVGLAPADRPQAAATLAATGLDGPLFLVGPGFSSRLLSELRRLAPDQVIVAGFDEEILASALSEFEVIGLEVDPEVSLKHHPGKYERIWLVAPGASTTPFMVTAVNLGIGLMVVESDLQALPEETRDLISDAEQVDLLGEFEEDVAWQLDVIRSGHEIPGGGLVMFDGEVDRRLVALYGHPSTSLLGVLGEQDPEGGIARLEELASAYEADGAMVLPTFEIIATVASAGPGRDGDYSAETDRDVIRPWIEAAAANGVYVILDLQPGRTDFLTQAKSYEEFLRLPHVGLALDPEWRLKPDQVHLRQIGTVDGSEINQVVRWLAGIVREESLPQKLLIVHQFRFSMITNRDLIEIPTELAVVIQMDGQGSLASKYETWGALTRGVEESELRWGWKNFYDEDSPTATPAQVLELTPAPVFVSYQ